MPLNVANSLFVVVDGTPPPLMGGSCTRYRLHDLCPSL